VAEDLLEKKEMILQKAIQLFGSNGRLTIRELSKATGVNVASITYYFGGKDNLLAEIETRLFTDLDIIIRQTAQETGNPQEKLFHLLYRLVSLVTEQPGILNFLGQAVRDEASTHRMQPLSEEILLGHFKDEVIRLLEEATGITSEQELHNRYMIAFSAVTQPILGQMLARNEFDMRPYTPMGADTIEDFIRSLTRILCSR
jgi:AcrR family transcriptional regulator